MKRLDKFLVLIALFCGILLTACTDGNIDEPSVTPEVKPVVNDMMDTSVKPGEDFFRYCNGKWIDALTVDMDATKESSIQYYGFFPTEIQKTFNKNLSELEYPSLEVISKHFASLATDQAACDDIVEAAKKLLNDAADNGREQLWLTIGQMIKEGYPLPISVEMVNKKDIMGIMFSATESISYYDQEDNPVVEPGSESAIGAEWPMLKKISEGMNFDVKYCYLPTEVTYFGMGDEPMDMSMFARGLASIQACRPKTIAESFGKALETSLVRYYNSSSEDKEYNNSLISELKDGFLRYEGHRDYVKKFVKPETKSSLKQLCERLRKAYRKRLETNLWMNGDSKTKAIEKLDNITFCLGYPDTWYDNAMPDLSNTKNIVEDYLELGRAKLVLMSDLLGKTVHEAEFNACFFDYFPTLVVNARYKPDNNSIQIYPVFLSEPFVNSSGLSVEMFAYSMIYAHEITHGFDSRGALYDKYGCVGSILAEADKAEFNKRILLLDDCYSSMETLPGSNVMCDGKTTEAENIADLGGFLIAYDACKAWLEEEKGVKGEDLKQQMTQFCIAYGNLWRSKYTLAHVKKSIGVDGHSYNRERVNGVVRNSDVWYELFDIKPGDALYLAPEKRAYIW